MNFFENVPKAPPDPIFGVRIAFDKDPRPNKINLGIGVYRTDDLKPLLLDSVKKGEEILLKTEKNKEYLPIGGDPELIDESMKLVFGKDVDKGKIAAIQTVGGTSALRIGGQLIINHVGKEFFLSDPTWDNHHRLFANVGFNLKYFPYYDKKRRDFDKQGMIEVIKKMPQNSILFLQGCCHNPTGFDPSFEDWKEIGEIVKERKLLPFFDFAYQGFGDGIEEDAQAIRYFVKEKIPILVASSFSKNFGLYSERVGLLFVVLKNEDEKERVDSQLKFIIRTLYSNPPSHGGRVVALILKDPELKKLWEREVATMRNRISAMREALYIALQKQNKSNKEEFAFLTKQKGMFSFTGLTERQVEMMVREFGIYMLKEGRINVSGLNSENIDYVAEAIDRSYRHR